MAWSKVNSEHKKPLGWWFHKLLCEIGYSIGNTKMYYKNLHIMCDKYKFNLYGTKI